MIRRKFNVKLVIVALVLFILSYLMVSNQQDFLRLARYIFIWKHLEICIWLIFSICFFVHYLSIKDDAGNKAEDNHNQILIFFHFSKFANSAFAVITYSIASTTSISLLKGIFFQQVLEEQIYFINFGQLDIYSILIVCIFLFFYSIQVAAKALFYAITYRKAEEITAVTNDKHITNNSR